MTPENDKPINTDNELIAEFMNLRVRHWKKGILWITREDENDYIDFVNGTVYAPDRDWNQLMAVVEKIHMSGKMVTVYFYTKPRSVLSKIYIWGHGESQQESDSAIESVYKSVVEAIKMFNFNQPKP